MKDLSLRRMESRTWRLPQQTGLFDIYFGALMLAIALSALAEGLGAPPWVRLGTLIVLQFGAAALYGVARQRYVVPRLGVARFARQRVRRSRGLAIALGACVLITALLVVSTALGRSPVSWFSALGIYALPTVIAFIIGLPFSAIAAVLESPRILLHGTLLIACPFALAATGHDVMAAIPGAIAFGVAGSISTGIGIASFVRFLSEMPARVESGGPYEL